MKTIVVPNVLGQTRCTMGDVQMAMMMMMHINPLSPNGDQHQFSPNNIHTLSRDTVMRINEIITTEKMLRSLIKFSQLPF